MNELPHSTVPLRVDEPLRLFVQQQAGINVGQCNTFATGAANARKTIEASMDSAIDASLVSSWSVNPPR
jgi:hypothetical protein